MSMTTLLKKQNQDESGTGKKAKSEGLDNPYLTARRTWNEHVGSLVTAKQTWQVIALLSMLIALASIGGIIHIGSQSKFIPYVIEMDKLGRVQASGFVEATSPADPRIIHATLAEFIQDARTVTPDINLQTRALHRLYTKINPNDPAKHKMDDWLNGTPDSNPFKRAEKEMVNIDIRSVIPQSESAWQVEWSETTRDRQGIQRGSPVIWRALITLYQAEVSAQTTDEDLRANPLSLYVRDFSWSRVSQQGSLIDNSTENRILP